MEAGATVAARRRRVQAPGQVGAVRGRRSSSSSSTSSCPSWRGRASRSTSLGQHQLRLRHRRRGARGGLPRRLQPARPTPCCATKGHRGRACCASTCRAWPSATSCRAGPPRAPPSPTGCSPNRGSPAPTPGSRWPCRGWAPPLVLNVILWLALFVSVFVHGYNPLYAVAAGAGVVLMGLFAAVVVALTRGRRPLGRGHPALGGPSALPRRRPGSPPRSIGWPTGWASSWPSASCCTRAVGVGGRRSGCSTPLRCSCSSPRWASSCPPSTFWSPTAWPRCWPSSPSRRRGLGVVEGVLIPTLVGFGVSKPTAILGVLGYRLVNFWLPIPVGGIAYLSLRFSNERWPTRLRHAPQGGPARRQRRRARSGRRRGVCWERSAAGRPTGRRHAARRCRHGLCRHGRCRHRCRCRAASRARGRPWQPSPHQASPRQQSARHTPRLEPPKPNAAHGSASA